MEKEEVPTVSLELYEKDFAGFVRALGEAYERYGFVILENHGIPQEMIERAMDRSKAFFACEESCKKKYTLTGLGGARGYTAFGVETAKGAEAPGKCAVLYSFFIFLVFSRRVCCSNDWQTERLTRAPYPNRFEGVLAPGTRFAFRAPLRVQDASERGRRDRSRRFQ